MMKRDAFLYFVVQRKKVMEARARCRLFRNLKEVASMALPIWEAMNHVQRQPYVLMEKQYNDDIDYLNRHGTLVRNISDIEEMMCTKANKAILAQTLFEDHLQRAVARNDLDNLDLYFISMGYFCRTYQQTYLPAELGIVRYNLKCSVKDQLHTLINPGAINLCDEHEAILHSKRTHTLPIPPDALGIEEYDEIAEMILKFTEAQDKFRVLFTDADSVPRVEDMLSEILINYPEGKTVYVCSLPELFCKLQQALKYKNETVLTAAKVQEMLDDDVFSRAQRISCEYHESRNLPVHCALSRCVRWAYTISDIFCPVANIPMTIGQHIPTEEQMGMMPSGTTPTTLLLPSGMRGLVEFSLRKDDTSEEPVTYSNTAPVGEQFNNPPTDVEPLIESEIGSQDVNNELGKQNSCTKSEIEAKPKVQHNPPIRHVRQIPKALRRRPAF